MWVEPLILLGLIAVVAALLAHALGRVRLGVRIVLSAAVATIVVLLAAWHVARAPWQLMGVTVDRVRTDKPVVALTFDDGPTREWTGPVLATLEREGVRATFFLIGESVDANPAEARAIVDAGHEVGNHSYTHQRMVLRSAAFVRSEIERTDAALGRAGWQERILFRSPYCKKFFVLPHYLSQNGRVNVFWDVQDSPAADAPQLASAMLAHTRTGSVILMHVMYDSGQRSREALPLIIRGLRARGFGFVTVSELMNERRP